MKQWTVMGLFIIVNILVSACTTYLVLMAWERSHPAVGVIAGRSGELVATKAAATGTAAAPAGGVALQVTPTREYVIYRVESGDTFESIAQAYNITVDELLEANGFTHDQTLGAGEALRVPVGPTPVASATVIVENVVGTGDLEAEHVVVKHAGGTSISLAGWSLEDQNGNVFTFPAVDLISDGARVNVFTRSGADTADTLYWGLEAPIWEPGEVVTLRDAQGRDRSDFTIP